MTTIFIVVFSVIYLLVLYNFYIAICGRIRVFSITSFFCLCYISFAYIGSVLLNIMHFEAEDYLGMYARPDIFFLVWVFTLLGLLFLLLGFAIANIVFKYICYPRKNRDLQLIKVSISCFDNSDKILFVILFLFILSFFVLLVYRNAIGGFPLESVFSADNGAALAFLRSEATNNFSGKFYRYVMFMETLPLFLFIVVSFIKSCKKKKWKYLYIALFLYNLFYSLSTIQKAPILKFLLLCCIIFFYKDGFINKKIVLKLVVFSCALVLIMYMCFMGLEDAPIEVIIEGALHRIFIGAVHPFYWYIKYAEEFGFLYGTSFPNPAGIFPFESFRLTVEIMNYAKGDLLGDLVGSMPTVYIGEMYINFGLYGLALASLMFGFILQTLDILFVRYLLVNKSVLVSSLYIYMIYYFSQFTETGISGIIIDTDLYIVLFISFVYCLINRYNLRRYGKKKGLPCYKCTSCR